MNTVVTSLTDLHSNIFKLIPYINIIVRNLRSYLHSNIFKLILFLCNIVTSLIRRFTF